MTKDYEHRTPKPLSLLTLGCLIAAFVFLVLFCIRNIYSYDYWWHIASGRWILENGIMRADPFSFTAKDAPLVDPYWLAQIMLYALGGAVVIFKAAVIVAAFVFSLFAAPKQMRFSLPAAALVLLGAFVAHERFLCRPEIFTLLFCAITLWVLFNLSKRKNYAVFIIPALTLLWANLHPGWVLAPLLLCAYSCGRLLGRWLGFSTSSESVRRELLMLAATGLCFIAAFANPYFSQIVTYPFHLTLSTSHDISAFVEWVSPLPHLTSTLFTTELLHFKILALALIGSFILNYRQFDFGHAAIAALIFILSLTSYRHFGIFTLTAIPITLANLKPFWQNQFMPRLSNAKLKFLHLGVSIVVIATSIYYCEEVVTNRYYAKRELYSMSFGIGISDTSFPAKYAEVFSGECTLDKYFNSYELGGHIIYMKPGSHIFIDGRLVHYPKKVFDAYQKIQTQPKNFESLASGSQSAVVIHNMPRMQALVKYLHKNPHWKLRALDHVMCQYIHLGFSDPDIKVSVESLMQSTYPDFAFLSVGRFYLTVEEYDKAAEILEVGCKRFPKNGKLNLFYGRALAGIGKLEEARAVLEKTTGLLPESAEAHLNLGVTYWKLGEEDKARRSWKRVLEIEPDNEQALEYMQREAPESK